jgi:hypothetical protein
VRVETSDFLACFLESLPNFQWFIIRLNLLFLCDLVTHPEIKLKKKKKDLVTRLNTWRLGLVWEIGWKQAKLSSFSLCFSVGPQTNLIGRIMYRWTGIICQLTFRWPSFAGARSPIDGDILEQNGDIYGVTQMDQLSGRSWLLNLRSKLKK